MNTKIRAAIALIINTTYINDRTGIVERVAHVTEDDAHINKNAYVNGVFTAIMDSARC